MQTQQRVLDAARRLFCRAGFDQLGVRELAAAAAVDPAVVIRLFGSKKAPFAAVAADAFALMPPFDGPMEGWGRRVAWPILSASLHAGFIRPLTAHLAGEAAALRASMATACVLGFVTLRVALAAPALEPDAVERLGAVLQACLDTGPV